MDSYTISIIAIVLSPVIAVWVGQVLQNRAKRREDKMDILKVLMKYRADIFCCFDKDMPENASKEVYTSLNLIELVFINSSDVIEKGRSLISFMNEFAARNKENDGVLLSAGEFTKKQAEFNNKFWELVNAINKDLDHTPLSNE